MADKVLIVDDSGTDRELLKEILSGSSVVYDVRMAGSGREALAAIDHEPPDLILLDIQMKEVGGFETVEKLRAKGNTIPILLVSGFSEEDDRLRGLKLGVTDFIAKPIIAEEVKARVACHLKLKKVVDDSRWVAEKTNKGIRLLYRELEKKNEQLKKYDLLKSQFVANVSHEYKSPLAIIRECISLILDGITGEINDQQREYLTRALKTVNRINRLVMDMLDVSKIESGKMQLARTQFDPGELARGILLDFEVLAQKKNIELRAELGQDVGKICGDWDKVIQVITNIVSNAVKYTPAGGHVFIALKDEGADSIRIEVADTGPGLSPQDIGKVFNKYERVMKEKQEGTGLGLPIAKEIVLLHKGKIWVESEVGKGSKFIVILPRDSSPAQ